MLLPLMDIATTGFSRRWHEITVIWTIVYDAAAHAERQHRCFNVFCVRGADALARRCGVDEARRRRAPRPLRRRRRVQRHPSSTCRGFCSGCRARRVALGAPWPTLRLPGHGLRRIQVTVLVLTRWLMQVYGMIPW